MATAEFAGIGVENKGTETWIASSSSFNSILARLNAAYGTANKPTEDETAGAEKPEDTSAPEVAAEKSEQKKKKSRKKRHVAAEATDEPAAEETEQ